MGSDITENVRRQLVSQLNAVPKGRAELQAEHGEVWDSDELLRDFEPVGFLAPFVIVKRRNDGVLGSLMFQHGPRFYFRFLPD